MNYWNQHTSMQSVAPVAHAVHPGVTVPSLAVVLPGSLMIIDIQKNKCELDMYFMNSTV